MLYNRDLSWIGFNHRVLQEAKDESLPIYERIKFLAIFSSNMDEFFRVRYPEVVALSKLGKKLLRTESFLSEDEISTKVHSVISAQQEEYGKILMESILPELSKHGIELYYNKPFLPEHLDAVREIFFTKVLSFIRPIELKNQMPESFLIENSQLYLAVSIVEADGEMMKHKLVNIPTKGLGRFVVLPEIEGKKYVAFLDDIVRENLKFIFPGQEIRSVYSIKLNRNADLELDENFTGDLLEKIEKQLPKRNTGNTSRFLFERTMPANLQLYLASVFKASITYMFAGGRYHNLSDLMSFPKFDTSLEAPKHKPIVYPKEAVLGKIFELAEQKDFLLHLPYHAYSPVLTFFNQAAIEPDVTDIYVTLYRVARESHIVNALISAAQSGKNVTAFVELKARFDEENNIKWSRVMKKAGVKLVYSDVGIKVHSKIGLVKRKDGRMYSIICTGNFNESTAGIYTDHALFTTQERVCKELEKLFEFLRADKPDMVKARAKLKFKELYVAQFNMLPRFEGYINREIKKARRGKAARIRIKVNNLEEPYFINLLYKASQAGVKVDLIVRSICSLIPGVEGLSENITVKRLVDGFLEHSRIFIFGADDNVAEVVMGSSDLMTRNLRRRIEVCIGITDADCRRQLLDYFDIQWRDNTKACELDSEMNHVPIQAEHEKINAQNLIQQYVTTIL